MDADRPANDNDNGHDNKGGGDEEEEEDAARRRRRRLNARDAQQRHRREEAQAELDDCFSVYIISFLPMYFTY